MVLGFWFLIFGFWFLVFGGSSPSEQDRRNTYDCMLSELGTSTSTRQGQNICFFVIAVNFSPFWVEEILPSRTDITGLSELGTPTLGVKANRFVSLLWRSFLVSMKQGQPRSLVVIHLLATLKGYHPFLQAASQIPRVSFFWCV